MKYTITKLPIGFKKTIEEDCFVFFENISGDFISLHILNQDEKKANMKMLEVVGETYRYTWIQDGLVMKIVTNLDEKAMNELVESVEIPRRD